MRAVLRASFAARRKARPTPAAKLLDRFTLVCVFAFMDSSPRAGAYGQNCRTQPSYQPEAYITVQSSPSFLRTFEERHAAAHHGHPAGRGPLSAAVPVECSAIVDTRSRRGSRNASKLEIAAHSSAH